MKLELVRGVTRSGMLHQRLWACAPRAVERLPFDGTLDAFVWLAAQPRCGRCLNNDQLTLVMMASRKVSLSVPEIRDLVNGVPARTPDPITEPEPDLPWISWKTPT